MVPIRINVHSEILCVDIHDIGESFEKLILKLYANVADGSQIELVALEGELFYSIFYSCHYYKNKLILALRTSFEVRSFLF